MPKEKTKSAVARRIRRRNTTLAVMTVILLVVIALFTPIFDITEIDVTGNKILSGEDVINASGIKKGSNLFLIDTDKCEEKINALGYVDSVEVRRKFLAGIEIQIKESEEAAFIAFSGSYVGIGADGKVLSITKSSEKRPKKAVISGFAVKNVKKGQTIEGKSNEKTKIVKELMGLLSQSGVLTSVKKIDVSDKTQIMLTLNSDTKIVLGDSEQLEYKMKCADAVRKELGEIRGGKINVSDPSNVIYEGGS